MMTAWDYRVGCDLAEDGGLHTLTLRLGLERVLCRMVRPGRAVYGYGYGYGDGYGDGYGYGYGDGDGDG
jgi:hypothetical protein